MIELFPDRDDILTKGIGGLKLSNNKNKKQECRRVQKSKLPEIWLNQNHFNVLIED